jgi:hypothetical protein
MFSKLDRNLILDRFCDEELTEDGGPACEPVHEAGRADQDRDINVVQLFLEWVLDKSNIQYLDTMMVFCRVWRQSFRQYVGRGIDHCFIAAMKSVQPSVPSTNPEANNDQHVQGELAERYELSGLKQFRGTMDNDDVFAVLYHHWALCTDYYPNERQRLQHALLILLCAGTSSRPGTVVEGSGYRGTNDALKYRDIKVHLVRDPDNPERKFVLALVTLRLFKGKRNTGSP